MKKSSSWSITRHISYHNRDPDRETPISDIHYHNSSKFNRYSVNYFSRPHRRFAFQISTLVREVSWAKYSLIKRKLQSLGWGIFQYKIQICRRSRAHGGPTRRNNLWRNELLQDIASSVGELSWWTANRIVTSYATQITPTAPRNSTVGSEIKA